MKNNKVAKVTTDSRTYRILTTIDQDIYFDECWSLHTSSGQHTKSTRKWKKKQLYAFQVRMYKTWKHNRKTKWKVKEHL